MDANPGIAIAGLLGMARKSKDGGSSGAQQTGQKKRKSNKKR